MYRLSMLTWRGGVGDDCTCVNCITSARKEVVAILVERNCHYSVSQVECFLKMIGSKSHNYHKISPVWGVKSQIYRPPASMGFFLA